MHELERESVFLKHPKVLELARPRIGSARAERGLRIGAEGLTVLVKDYVAKIYVLELWLIWKVLFWIYEDLNNILSTVYVWFLQN